MNTYWLGAAMALWLGILTSISPCPLATNIAAISYISRRLNNTFAVLLAGILYMFGRMATYMGLGIILTGTLLSIPQTSHLLQKYMNMLMGPILILVGMMLLGLLSFTFSGSGISEKMQARVERWGLWGAALLGVAFALSFCPVSAALFFGNLIPLAAQNHSPVGFPLLYGIGTALPVLAFAIFIALGAKSLAAAFNKITQAELWARYVTGTIFILVGIYLSLVYTPWV